MVGRTGCEYILRGEDNMYCGIPRRGWWWWWEEAEGMDRERWK